MPVAVPNPHVGGPGQGADMFLHVQSAKAGKIKGESSVPGQVDDILLSGWSWGLQAHTAMGSTEVTSRRSYTGLTVHKQLDRASTGLMAALVTNALIKEAKLTMRRAGGSQLAFWVITLKDARIVRVDHQTSADGGTIETVGINFTTVDIEYKQQQAGGLIGGGYTVSDQLMPAA